MTQVQRGVRYAHSHIRVGSISFCLVTPSLFWYTIGHESKCQNYGFKLRKLFRQINIGRSLLCLTMTVAKLSHSFRIQYEQSFAKLVPQQIFTYECPSYNALGTEMVLNNAHYRRCLLVLFSKTVARLSFKFYSVSILL